MNLLFQSDTSWSDLIIDLKDKKKLLLDRIIEDPKAIRYERLRSISIFDF